MTSKMFKMQAEPQAAGEWFRCKVLNVFDVISVVYKSTDHRKLLSMCFYNNIPLIGFFVPLSHHFHSP